MPEGTSDNPNPPSVETPSAIQVVSSGTTPHGNLSIAYTPTIAENVACLFAEGSTLAAIGRLPDMPTAATLYRWLHKYPEFRQILDNARVARAFQDEDQARDALDENDPERSSLARLKFEGYMSLAAVNHPERYGKRTTVQGDDSKPIRFVIQTGVPAPQNLPQVEKEVVAEVAQAAAETEGPCGAD